MENKRILYCRIGWMNSYKGLDNDCIVNGGSYEDKYEVYNFLNHDGSYYGYVEPLGKIHIERLGASLNDDTVEDVLVVWVATRKNGGTVIVGWYKDATVYKEVQNMSEEELEYRDDKSRNIYNVFSMEATLIPPYYRDFLVDVMGRHPVRFCENEDFNRKVLDYISKCEDNISLWSNEEEDEYKEAARKLDYYFDTYGVRNGDRSLEQQIALRNNFINKYNTTQLRKYNGIDVWDKIWDHGDGGMIYALRNSDAYMEFGSAKSQDVRGLPMHKNDDGTYYAGRNNEIIGQKGALSYGERFRDRFVECIDYVRKTRLESIEDFSKLGDYLDEKLDNKGKQMWVHKYLHMLFPDKFSQFHSEDFKRDVLCALGVRPFKSYYGMAGQIYQIKKYSKIGDYQTFAGVIYKRFPAIGKIKTYLVHAKPEYVGEIMNWSPNSIITLDTSMFYDLYENKVFQQKTEENKDRKEKTTHLFVIVDKQKPLGVVDSFIPKKETNKTSYRQGEWKCIFYEGDSLNIEDNPKKKVGPVSDSDLLIQIYDRYFANYDSISALERNINEGMREKEDEYLADIKPILDSFFSRYSIDNGMLLNELQNRGDEYQKNVNSLSIYDGVLLPDIEYDDNVKHTIMLLAYKEEINESCEISDSLKARILGIYHPDKYVCLSDEDFIDEILIELGIPFFNEHNLWIKNSLIRNWIAKKFGAYTDDAYLQNYIFVKCAIEYYGVEFAPISIKPEIILHSISDNIRKEYEIIESEDEESVWNDKFEKDEASYSKTPAEKIYTDKKDSTGRKIPYRDPIKRINAMKIAGFKCEIDPSHPTFISRKFRLPYVESHHFIPIEFHEDFEYSLDVEENIVCLCSNCHNEIHYGLNGDKLVHILYEARKDLLESVGLSISEKELISKAYKYDLHDMLD